MGKCCVGGVVDLCEGYVHANINACAQRHNSTNAQGTFLAYCYSTAVC